MTSNLILKHTSSHEEKERHHYARYHIIVKKSGIEAIEALCGL